VILTSNICATDAGSDCQPDMYKPQDRRRQAALHHPRYPV
jgi:hypothetical protein